MCLTVHEQAGPCMSAPACGRLRSLGASFSVTHTDGGTWICPSQEAYETGVQHYDADEYLQAVARLEESLSEALTALEECRALCEGPWEDEDEEEKMQPGLYEAIAGSVGGTEDWVGGLCSPHWAHPISQHSCLEEVWATAFLAPLSCSPLYSGFEVQAAVCPGNCHEAGENFCYRRFHTLSP